MARAGELNFDGIVGPTHNYAGLSYGNVASMVSKGQVANPRQAALQGLAKMRVLAGLGVPQAVLPPHERPDLSLLRALGCRGRGPSDDAGVLAEAAATDPVLLAAASSASAMWTANAATVSPSADSADGRVHITPANLVSHLHRSLEPRFTRRLLAAVFADRERFVVHGPLPATPCLGDEGAANHMRLAPAHGEPGLEVFVYGRRGLDAGDAITTRYPARHTRETCEALARRHGVPASRTLFLRQSREAIDAGAFHNDVVAVSNERVLLHHPRAWEEGAGAIASACAALGWQPTLLCADVPLSDAVSSYLFNSQLVTLPDGGTALVAARECGEVASVRGFLAAVLDEGTAIRAVHYVDIRQSMMNGGGPACLRLRVVLTAAEQSRVAPGVLWSESLDRKLVAWVERHYRDRLTPADLADPGLLGESRAALDELTPILGLGSLYDFQREGADCAADGPS